MPEKTNVPVRREEKREVTTARRWDPLAELRAVEAEMDRWREAFWPFARRPLTPPSHWPRAAETGWSPRMDVYRKDGNLVIKAELPGLKPEEVEVSVEAGDLIITGERTAEKEVKDEDFYRMERSYGKFYRRQPLPEGIKPEQITATFANGVLEVTIPAPAEAKAETQKIPITTK